MLALRLCSTRNCVRFSRALPQSHFRLSHTDSKSAEPAKLKVYEGSLRTRLRWVKVLSLSSSAIFLGLTPILSSKIFASNSNAMGYTISGAFVVMALSTPVILQFIAGGYVNELRFEPETKVFEADTFDFFGRTKTIKFTQDDVAFPALIGPLSNLTIKEKSYLIDVESVSDPDAYDVLMKYDKPIDLMLGKDPEKEDNS